MTRLLSALVLIGIVGGVVWRLPWWATVGLAALVAALAGRELARLGGVVRSAAPPAFVGFLAAVVVVAVAVQPVLPEGARQDLLLAVLLGGLVASCAVALVSGPPSVETFTRAALTLAAPIYVGLPLGALGWVQASAGPRAVTWFLAVMAASDSAQYYTGRLFGRRKLAPLVSPAKTIEGAIGGLAAATLAGGVLARFGLGDSIATGALVALVIAAAGMLGDLFESLLKRSVGVKDSAALIPGHGGVLDWIDSYLLAAPLFYLYLSTLG